MLSSPSAILERDPGCSHRRRAVEHSLFGMLPVLVAGLAFYFAFSGGYAAGDFTHSFLVAGWRELHGGDPYHWTRAQFAAQVSFPYPALAVVLLEPLALLPGSVAGDADLLLCLTAIAGTLRLLGVRDWRVYGAVFLWSPVLIGWQTGNFTLPLMFGCAAAWRYRDHPWLIGLIAALLISIKPTMFPVGIWLLATRRYRAAVISVAFALALNLVSWTLIGWNELGHLLHLVSIQSQAMYHTGYSVIALAAHLGASQNTGIAVQAVVALMVLVACVNAGRAGRQAAALSLAVALCLVASPLIDQHYFALLVVPLALAFPRLRWPWLAPLALWLCPATGGAAWQVAVWLLVAATTVAAVVSSVPNDVPTAGSPVLGGELQVRDSAPEHRLDDPEGLALGGGM
jgi:hypothetical protein